MKKMKYIGTLLLAITFSSTWAQKDVKSWLYNDCGSGDEVSEAQKMAVMYSEEMKMHLEDALANGPSDIELQEVREAAAYRFEQNQATLASGRADFLTAEQKAKIQTVSKETFVEQEVSNFRVRYEQQAKKGLSMAKELEKQPLIAAETSPSPVVDQVRFSFVAQQNTNFTVELYSVSGAFIDEIFTGAANAKVPVVFQYNAASLAEGVYVYKILAGNEVYVQKFVVRK